MNNINYTDIPLDFLNSKSVSLFYSTRYGKIAPRYGTRFHTIGDMIQNLEPCDFRRKAKDPILSDAFYKYYINSLIFTEEFGNAVSKDSSLNDIVIAFVKSFVKYSINSSKVLNKFTYLYEGFPKLYLYDSFDTTIYTLDDLARVSGKTTQAYRNAYDTLIFPYIHDILLGRDKWLNVPSFVSERFQSILDCLKDNNVIMQTKFNELFRNFDARSKAFFLKFIGYAEFASAGSLFEPMLIRKDWCEITALNKVEGKIIKLLSETQCGISIRYKLLPTITNDKSPEHLGDALEEIFRKSDHFDLRETIDGDVIVALKWKYLSNANARIERLLYLQNLQNPENPYLSIDEILKRYNTEARINGLEEITMSQLNIKKTKFMAPKGKTGFWFYTEGKKVDFIKAEDFVKNYVLEHQGRVKFSEVYTAAQEKGYLNTEKSIRTYLTNCCYSVNGTQELFVYKDYADKFAESDGYTYNFVSRCIDDVFIPMMAKVLSEAPDKTMRERELLKKLVSPEGEHMPSSTLTYLLRNDLKDFVYIHNENRKSYVKLIVEPSECVRTKKASKKPTYYRLTYQEAVEILKEKKGEMPLKDLKAATIHFLPSDINPNNIYKVFNEPIFTKTQRGTTTYVSLNPDIYKEEYFDKEESYPVEQHQNSQEPVQPENIFSLDWGLFKQFLSTQFKATWLGVDNIDSALEGMAMIMGKDKMPMVGSEFWKILLGLQQLYMGKTSPNDRELLMSKLALQLENYLKNLYELKNSEAMSDTIGLYHVISSMQSNGLLPERYDESSTLASNLNKMTGKILYIRNNIAHADESKMPSMVDIINAIRSVLEYYVLVAAWNVSKKS